jgi:trehalose synthase
MEQFVPPHLPVEQIAIIAPAIDPLSPKNIELPANVCSRILNWVGLESQDPFVVQASRFDPWKDPLGVIAAYRMVRQHMPDLQLVLVGSMALDDPQGWDIYRQIMAAAETDPLIHVFTNLTGVGNVEVNCLQRQASVVIQKSIREGFGLVVSEALWKGTPIVAGKAGGIPLQMPDGVGGYLVESVEETAERLAELLTNPVLARRLGHLGHEHVKEHFLLPRLLADEIKLIAEVTNKAGGIGDL